MAYTTAEDEEKTETSWLSQALYGINRIVGDRFGWTQTGGFLTDEQRAELNAGLTGEDISQLQLAKQTILKAKIAELKKTGDTQTQEVLQNYLNNGTSPQILDDIALAAIHAKGEIGLMEKISIVAEGVMDGISGRYEAGTQIVDKSNMGFLERIQARISEVGAAHYRADLKKELKTLAAKNGTTDKIAGSLEEVLNGAQLAAFKETGKMVGMAEVTDTQLVGVFAKKDAPTPAVG